MAAKISDARMKANRKYNEKAYFRPSIFFRNEEKDYIYKYASQFESFNAFVHEAVYEKIERMEQENIDKNN